MDILLRIFKFIINFINDVINKLLKRSENMSSTFNEDGTYNKTEWKAGDRITADKLNKIEESLEQINNNDIARHIEADARLDALEGSIGTANEEVMGVIKSTENELKNSDAEIKTNIYKIEKDYKDADVIINTTITTVAENLSNEIQSLTTDMETADSNLTSKINILTNDMKNSDTILQTNIDTLRNDMTAEDTKINTNIDMLHKNMVNADTRLQTDIANLHSYNESKMFYITPQEFKNENNSWDNAFQSCIAHAKTHNTPIRIPAGIYILSQPLLIDFGINMEGSGYETILQFEGLTKGDACIDIYSEEHQINYVNLGNMRINGSRVTDAETHGLKLNRDASAAMNTPIVNSNFHDLFIHNCDIGILAHYIWCDVFTNVRVQNAYRAFRLKNQVNNILFDRCSFVNYDAYCDMTNCEGLQFNSCEIANTNGSVLDTYQSNAIFYNTYMENLQSCPIRIGNDSEVQPSALYFYGGIIGARFMPKTHKITLRIQDARFTSGKFTIEQPQGTADKALSADQYLVRGWGMDERTYHKKFVFGEDEFPYYDYAWGGGTSSHEDKGYYCEVNSDSGINLRTECEVGKQYLMELEIASDGLTGLGFNQVTNLPLSMDYKSYFKTFYIPFQATSKETRLLFNGILKIKKLNIYNGL